MRARALDIAALREAEPVRILGIEILALTVVAIKPTPDIARALEADAREGLQRQADEAIYARRNASVEQERRIKESERLCSLSPLLFLLLDLGCGCRWDQPRDCL